MRRATFALVVLLGACSMSRRSVQEAPTVVGAPPAELLGTFEDDYGSVHRVSASAWRHGTHSTYEVLSWHSEAQYFIARNATSNRSGGGLYTRIDWMRLDGMAPYTLAFCLSAYEAVSVAAAESVRVANRSTPRTGCNGFPFSRLKRVNLPLD